MTKKSLAAALAALALSTGAFALENTVTPKVTSLAIPAPKTALYVGNSFTYYNCGINAYLLGFTTEEGRNWTARMTTIAGARLSFHSVEAYLAPAPLDQFDKNTPKFDVVFLQGQSSESIDDYAAANYQEYFAKHVKTIRAHGSEPIAVITWALQDKPEQTKLLADAITTEANKNDVLAIPVGLAFAESLKGRPGLILHNPDKRHPSAAGSYLFASVIYSALFHKSPEGFKFLGACEKPIAAEDAKYLQEVAWRVTKEFYGWK